MNRYFSFILFGILVILFVLLNTNNKISTSLLNTLPDTQNKELLEVYLQTQINKKLFLAIRGEDKKSLEKLKQIEQKLLEIEGLEKEQFRYNQKLQEYKKKYKLYLEDIDTNKLETLDVKKELKKLYQSITNSFFITTINKEDPFKLLEQTKQKLSIKNGRVLLDDFGYLSILSLHSDINTLQEYERVYDEVKKVEKNYTDIISFSPIYYFVENSRYIKNDTTTIAVIAITLLLLLYFVILRNISLLLNTLLTLSSSALFATIIVTHFYKEVSIFVLVFGISISTIAIDYMFHHYFHKHYEKAKSFNKEVFLGFLTTFGVFFILSLSDFILIEQITLFAMASLFFSYIIFAFVFPRIGFIQKELHFCLKRAKLFNTKYIFFTSMFIIVISALNLRFDFDISSLNYDNKELKEKELFFQKQISKQNRYTVILKANSIENLIKYNELLQTIDSDIKSPLNNIMTLQYFQKRKNKLSQLQLEQLRKKLQEYSQELGFRKETFKDAYNYNLPFPSFNYERLKEYGLSIKKYKGEYITFIQISKNKYEKILSYPFCFSVSVKKLFEKSLNDEISKLINLGLIGILFIITIMLFVGKQASLKAFVFLLFPSSLIMLYSNFIQINILHLFMFFIILAISIDYAIYSVKHNDNNTQKAILFSALSSFAGFGVLIVSNTSSLFSIGSVATIGIVGILILVFLRKEDESKSL
jgi:predicted exporter